MAYILQYVKIHLNILQNLLILKNLNPLNTTNTHIIYLLTHSMEHSPSWEANGFSVSQEIPRILLNPKDH